jgi:L-serine deaminase
MKIWQVMDECIRTGVSTTERTLPGRLNLRRRAPMLYQRLMRGCVAPPTITSASNPRLIGSTPAFTQARRSPLGQDCLLHPSMLRL